MQGNCTIKLLRYIRLLGAIGLMLSAMQGHGAVVCNVSSPGFFSGYNPLVAAPAFNTTQTNFTVTCAGGTPGATVNYSVRAFNGLQPAGGNNRAAFAGNFVRYDLYISSGCGTKWQGGANTLPTGGGTLVLNGAGAGSQTTSYWGCIPALQTVTVAGTYTDTFLMTLTYGALTANGNASVSILAPASCSMSTAPGDISFVYTSFQVGAATASTTFGVTCTNTLPYTMALDATSGTLPGVGLAYTLSLSTSSSTGTGVAQTHSVSGTMAGGQVGTCATASCIASQAHTLTVTY
jgi:spore coat protein U-like protein